MKKENALSEDEVRFLANRVVENIELSNDDMPSHPAWTALTELHGRGGEAALALCKAWRNGSPRQRRAAARILGQLGYSERPFAEERFSLLAEMLAIELQGSVDPAAINEICIAFGHLRDARAIGLVLPLTKHQSKDVRFGVVFALSGYDDADAVAGLLVLSRDDDGEVRDWATFGLGSQTDADTPELRDALMARLGDPDGDTDQEAILGLARRADRRVMPRIIELLNAGALSAPLLEAATILALPDFCPVLLAIAPDWLVFHVGEQRIDLTGYWRDAVATCGCVDVKNKTPA